MCVCYYSTPRNNRSYSFLNFLCPHLSEGVFKSKRKDAHEIITMALAIIIAIKDILHGKD